VRAIEEEEDRIVSEEKEGRKKERERERERVVWVLRTFGMKQNV